MLCSVSVYRRQFLRHVGKLLDQACTVCIDHSVRHHTLLLVDCDTSQTASQTKCCHALDELADKWEMLIRNPKTHRLAWRWEKLCIRGRFGVCKHADGEKRPPCGETE